MCLPHLGRAFKLMAIISIPIFLFFLGYLGIKSHFGIPYVDKMIVTKDFTTITITQYPALFIRGTHRLYLYQRYSDGTSLESLTIIQYYFSDTEDFLYLGRPIGGEVDTALRNHHGRHDSLIQSPPQNPSDIRTAKILNRYFDDTRQAMRVDALLAPYLKKLAEIKKTPPITPAPETTIPGVHSVFLNID